MKEIRMHGEYIQLDQALKKEDMISSGGETGHFLESHEVLLNGLKVHEKRKKLRPGDVLGIDGEEYRILEEKK